MSIQNLIENRDAIQFHSDLAFGKIAEKGTRSITISATSSNTTPIPHTYETPPKMIGWVDIDGAGTYYYMNSLALVTYDLFGYDLEIHAYSNENEYGFHVVNQDSSSHSLNIIYWLYFI